MWSRLIGKATDRGEETASRSSGRKDNDTTSTSTRRRASKVSKSSRGDDRDQGLNLASTSYSSNTRSPFLGTAGASVASSYATASANKANEEYLPPLGLVRNSTLADHMPKARSEHERRDQDDSRRQKSRRTRERSTPKNENVYTRRQSISPRRSATKSSKRGQEQNGGDRTNERGLGRSKTDPLDVSTRSPIQAGGSFSAQVGSAGFVQFPGQYDNPTSGFVGGPTGSKTHISDHVPDQFPGQFPIQSTAPYRPPLAATEGGPGLAADYYGDAGQSVAEQPGVRPHPPAVIVGAEPHLQPASSIVAPPPEPSASGAVGAAASFFADSFNTEAEAQANYSNTLASSNNAPVYQESPSMPSSAVQNLNLNKLDSNHHPSSAPTVPTLGAAAAGAAAGYLISQQSSSHQEHLDHGSSGGRIIYGGISSASNPPPSYQQPTAHNDEIFSAQSTRPAKHSFQPSHAPLYTAGVGGAAGLATASYQHNHHSVENSSSGQHYQAAPMAQRHHHKGPLSKLVDFFKDPDGVAQFEEYTEFIGVCKYCFEPSSSPRDAPRKHHYRRRRSDERLGSSTRVDKIRRYSSSDSETRRKNKNSWLAAGIAGYGVGKLGESFFNRKHDTNETNTPQFTRTHHSHKNSYSPDRRSHPSYGVTIRSSKAKASRSHSKDRIETGITSDGRTYKKDYYDKKPGGPSITVYDPQRPLKLRSGSGTESRSKHRKSGVAEAAIDASAGTSIVVSSSNRRNRSPQKRFVRSKHGSIDQSPASGLEASKKKDPHHDRLSRHSPSSSRTDISRTSQRMSIEGRQKTHKKDKKSRGFFGFGNGSSSISSSDGDSTYRIGSASRRSNIPVKARQRDYHNAQAVLNGLSAAAAALNLNETQLKKTIKKGEIETRSKSSRHGHHRDNMSEKSSTPSHSDEDLWVSASEDDYVSADSNLAYGGNISRSQGSLLSESSDMNKWGWGWSSKKKEKEAMKKQRHNGESVLPPPAGPLLAGLAEQAAQPPLVSGGGWQPTTKTGSFSNVPLRYFHPISTSDPSRFDALGQGSVMESSHPNISTRLDPITLLHHPQPVAPVPAAVYSTQPPHDHSYSAPVLPTVFSQHMHQSPPLDVHERRHDYVSLSQEKVLGSFPRVNQPPTGPKKMSEQRRRAASPKRRTADLPSTSFRYQDPFANESSVVRFEPTKEQAERDYRENRRQKRQNESRLDRRPQEEDQTPHDIEQKKPRGISSKPKLNGVGREGKSERKGRSEEKEEKVENVEPQIIEIEPQRQVSWATPAIVGIVGATIGGAKESVQPKPNSRGQESLKQKQKVYQDRDESSIHYNSQATEKDDREKSKNVEVQNGSGEEKPTPVWQAAAKVRSSTHEDYAAYFAPPELLSGSDGRRQVMDENADNDIILTEGPEIITIEPARFQDPSHSPAYSFILDEDESDLHLPWVPKLKLIPPTPTPSRVGSLVDVISPTIQPSEVHQADSTSSSNPKTDPEATLREPAPLPVEDDSDPLKVLPKNPEAIKVPVNNHLDRLELLPESSQTLSLSADDNFDLSVELPGAFVTEPVTLPSNQKNDLKSPDLEELVNNLELSSAASGPQLGPEDTELPAGSDLDLLETSLQSPCQEPFETNREQKAPFGTEQRGKPGVRVTEWLDTLLEPCVAPESIVAPASDKVDLIHLPNEEFIGTKIAESLSAGSLNVEHHIYPESITASAKGEVDIIEPPIEKSIGSLDAKSLEIKPLGLKYQVFPELIALPLGDDDSLTEQLCQRSPTSQKIESVNDEFKDQLDHKFIALPDEDDDDDGLTDRLSSRSPALLDSGFMNAAFKDPIDSKFIALPDSNDDDSTDWPSQRSPTPSNAEFMNEEFRSQIVPELIALPQDDSNDLVGRPGQSPHTSSNAVSVNGAFQVQIGPEFSALLPGDGNGLTEQSSQKSCALSNAGSVNEELRSQIGPEFIALPDDNDDELLVQSSQRSFASLDTPTNQIDPEFIALPYDDDDDLLDQSSQKSLTEHMIEEVKIYTDPNLIALPEDDDKGQRSPAGSVNENLKDVSEPEFIALPEDDDDLTTQSSQKSFTEYMVEEVKNYTDPKLIALSEDDDEGQRSPTSSVNGNFKDVTDPEFVTLPSRKDDDLTVLSGQRTSSRSVCEEFKGNTDPEFIALPYEEDDDPTVQSSERSSPGSVSEKLKGNTDPEFIALPSGDDDDLTVYFSQVYLAESVTEEFKNHTDAEFFALPDDDDLIVLSSKKSSTESLTEKSNDPLYDPEIIALPEDGDGLAVRSDQKSSPRFMTEEFKDRPNPAFAASPYEDDFDLIVYPSQGSPLKPVTEGLKDHSGPEFIALPDNNDDDLIVHPSQKTPTESVTGELKDQKLDPECIALPHGDDSDLRNLEFETSVGFPGANLPDPELESQISLEPTPLLPNSNGSSSDLFGSSNNRSTGRLQALKLEEAEPGQQIRRESTVLPIADDLHPINLVDTADVTDLHAFPEERSPHVSKLEVLELEHQAPFKPVILLMNGKTDPFELATTVNPANSVKERSVSPLKGSKTDNLKSEAQAPPERALLPGDDDTDLDEFVTSVDSADLPKERFVSHSEDFKSGDIKSEAQVPPECVPLPGDGNTDLDGLVAPTEPADLLKERSVSHLEAPEPEISTPEQQPPPESVPLPADMDMGLADSVNSVDSVDESSVMPLETFRSRNKESEASALEQQVPLESAPLPAASDMDLTSSMNSLDESSIRPLKAFNLKNKESEIPTPEEQVFPKFVPLLADSDTDIVNSVGSQNEESDIPTSKEQVSPESVSLPADNDTDVVNSMSSPNEESDIPTPEEQVFPESVPLPANSDTDIVNSVSSQNKESDIPTSEEQVFPESVSLPADSDTDIVNSVGSQNEESDIPTSKEQVSPESVPLPANSDTDIVNSVSSQNKESDIQTSEEQVFSESVSLPADSDTDIVNLVGSQNEESDIPTSKEQVSPESVLLPADSDTDIVNSMSSPNEESDILTPEEQVSPESVPLPADSDTDVVNSMSSPNDESDIPTSEEQVFPESVPLPADSDTDVVNSMSSPNEESDIPTSKEQVFPESVPLPADSDIDIVNSVSSPNEESDIPTLEEQVFPESVPLPADSDTDVVNSMSSPNEESDIPTSEEQVFPESVPLPADSDIDIVNSVSSPNEESDIPTLEEQVFPESVPLPADSDTDVVNSMSSPNDESDILTPEEQVSPESVPLPADSDTDVVNSMSSPNEESDIPTSEEQVFPESVPLPADSDTDLVNSMSSPNDESDILTPEEQVSPESVPLPADSDTDVVNSMSSPNDESDIPTSEEQVFPESVPLPADSDTDVVNSMSSPNEESDIPTSEEQVFPESVPLPADSDTDIVNSVSSQNEESDIPTSKEQVSPESVPLPADSDTDVVNSMSSPNEESDIPTPEEQVSPESVPLPADNDTDSTNLVDSLNGKSENQALRDSDQLLVDKNMDMDLLNSSGLLEKSLVTPLEASMTHDTESELQISIESVPLPVDNDINLVGNIDEKSIFLSKAIQPEVRLEAQLEKVQPDQLQPKTQIEEVQPKVLQEEHDLNEVRSGEIQSKVQLEIQAEQVQSEEAQPGVQSEQLQSRVQLENIQPEDVQLRDAQSKTFQEGNDLNEDQPQKVQSEEVRRDPTSPLQDLETVATVLHRSNSVGKTLPSFREVTSHNENLVATGYIAPSIDEHPSPTGYTLASLDLKPAVSDELSLPSEENFPMPSKIKKSKKARKGKKQKAPIVLDETSTLISLGRTEPASDMAEPMLHTLPQPPLEEQPHSAIMEEMAEKQEGEGRDINSASPKLRSQAIIGNRAHCEGHNDYFIKPPLNEDVTERIDYLPTSEIDREVATTETLDAPPIPRATEIFSPDFLSAQSTNSFNSPVGAYNQDGKKWQPEAEVHTPPSRTESRNRCSDVNLDKKSQVRVDKEDLEAKDSINLSEALHPSETDTLVVQEEYSIQDTLPPEQSPRLETFESTHYSNLSPLITIPAQNLTAAQQHATNVFPMPTVARRLDHTANDEQPAAESPFFEGTFTDIDKEQLKHPKPMPPEIPIFKDASIAIDKEQSIKKSKKSKKFDPDSPTFVIKDTPEQDQQLQPHAVSNAQSDVLLERSTAVVESAAVDEDIPPIKRAKKSKKTQKPNLTSPAIVMDGTPEQEQFQPPAVSDTQADVITEKPTVSVEPSAADEELWPPKKAKKSKKTKRLDRGSPRLGVDEAYEHGQVRPESVGSMGIDIIVEQPTPEESIIPDLEFTLGKKIKKSKKSKRTELGSSSLKLEETPDDGQAESQMVDDMKVNVGVEQSAPSEELIVPDSQFISSKKNKKAKKFKRIEMDSPNVDVEETFGQEQNELQIGNSMKVDIDVEQKGPSEELTVADSEFTISNENEEPEKLKRPEMDSPDVGVEETFGQEQNELQIGNSMKVDIDVEKIDPSEELTVADSEFTTSNENEEPEKLKRSELDSPDVGVEETFKLGPPKVEVDEMPELQSAKLQAIGIKTDIGIEQPSREETLTAERGFSSTKKSKKPKKSKNKDLECPVPNLYETPEQQSTKSLEIPTMVDAEREPNSVESNVPEGETSLSKKSKKSRKNAKQDWAINPEASSLDADGAPKQAALQTTSFETAQTLRPKSRSPSPKPQPSVLFETPPLALGAEISAEYQTKGTEEITVDSSLGAFITGPEKQKIKQSKKDKKKAKKAVQSSKWMDEEDLVKKQIFSEEQGRALIPEQALTPRVSVHERTPTPERVSIPDKTEQALISKQASISERVSTPEGGLVPEQASTPEQPPISEQQNLIKTEQHDHYIIHQSTKQAPAETGPGDIDIQSGAFQPENSTNRGSAIDVPDSLQAAEKLPVQPTFRDSGYQDIIAGPLVSMEPEFVDKSNGEYIKEALDPLSTEIELERDPDGQLHQISPHLETTSENSLNIITEETPIYEVTMSAPISDRGQSKTSDSTRGDAELSPHNSCRGLNQLQTTGSTFEDPREPSPVSSTTKERSSVLLQSSPSARDDFIDQPLEQQVPSDNLIFAENLHKKKSCNLPEQIQKTPLSEIGDSASDLERSLSPAGSSKYLNTNRDIPSLVLGGPVGISDELRTSSKSSFASDSSVNRQRLNTIAEHSPEESLLSKKNTFSSDVGSLERGSQPGPLSTIPKKPSEQRMRSPLRNEAAAPFIDELNARLSWPPVDEDNHTVNLDPGRVPNTKVQPSSGQENVAALSSGPVRQRAFSNASVGSVESINVLVRTPDQVRSASGLSQRGSRTPPLRRSDKIASGDLRVAHKKSEAKNLAKAFEAEANVAIPSSSTYDPTKDKGKTRVRDMTNIYVSSLRFDTIGSDSFRDYDEPDSLIGGLGRCSHGIPNFANATAKHAPETELAGVRS